MFLVGNVKEKGKRNEKIYLRNLKNNEWELHEDTLKNLQKEFKKRNISISLTAKLGINIKIDDWASVVYGDNLTKSMKDDIVQYIAKTLNIYPIKNKYIFYKRVNKISKGKYASCYDKNFIYEDNKIAKVNNPDLDINNSCSSDIHVSTPFYWTEGNTLIAVEVNKKDIITCLEGKIRCKKVKVIGEIKE